MLNDQTPGYRVPVSVVVNIELNELDGFNIYAIGANNTCLICGNPVLLPDAYQVTQVPINRKICTMIAVCSADCATGANDEAMQDHLRMMAMGAALDVLAQRDVHALDR